MHGSKINVHAGLKHKPLEKYDPNSFRSRLVLPSIHMPHKNYSQIVFGDQT